MERFNGNLNFINFYSLWLGPPALGRARGPNLLIQGT